MKAALTFLFEDGCRWSGGGVDFKNLSATHLFVDHAGSISYMDDGDEAYFRATSKKEVTPKWDVVTITTTTMSIPDRPKTLLFGKMYYTDELNARLAGLEVAK
ncbi:hypothetical protein CNR37_00153 [Pseudomonas phage ventosus]|uniref:Uncharacterized protein n=1 Tax=Pseudomonas phage ventosus TaxID=2048980 RepID=A0A2H4P8J0_9CAUD|nr:hypothetical protein CNR37_00153 [Pseudomonas phage ventosus]